MAASATKLQSVNEILTMAGSLRTNSLGSTRADVIMAETILDQTDRNIQVDGWHFNQQFNQEFAPNAQDEIVLTDDIFEVTESSGSDGPNRRLDQFSTDLAIRNGMLYDATNDTAVFTAAQKLNITRYVTFEAMPQYARGYIVARAARVFSAVTLGKRNPGLEEMEARARSTFLAAEVRNASYNMFRGQDMGWVSAGRGTIV